MKDFIINNDILIKYKGNHHQVIVPEQVTIIGAYAFSDSTFIEEIRMNNVLEIKFMAFGGCKNLKNVLFSKNLKKLDSCAFAGCSSIKNIFLPDEVEEIGTHCFANCKSLTKINIPKNLSKIGYLCFNYCPSLKYIDIDKNNSNFSLINGNLIYNKNTPILVKHIGTSTFQYHIYAESIESWAFEGRKDISFFPYHPNLHSIGSCAFMNSSIKEFVGRNLNIENHAFSNCEKLQRFHGSTISIGSNAFENCVNLSSVNLTHCGTIYSKAFKGCKSLNFLRLRGVSLIDDEAFCGCSSLKHLEIENKKVFLGENIFDECKDLTIFAPENSTVEKYAIDHNIKFKVLN